MKINDFEKEYLRRLQKAYNLNWLARDIGKRSGRNFLYAYDTKPKYDKRFKEFFYYGERDVCIDENIFDFSCVTFENSPVRFSELFEEIRNENKI